MPPKHPGKKNRPTWELILETVRRIELEKTADKFPARRKVQKQLGRAARFYLSDITPNLAVKRHNKNDILIKQSELGGLRKQYQVFSRIAGDYTTLRTKFSESGEKTIASEIMQIRLDDEALFVDWFYLIDEDILSRFSGYGLYDNGFVWLFLHSDDLEGRFRVCSVNATYWGRRGHEMQIVGELLSTTPTPGDEKPSTRTVVIQPIKEGLLDEQITAVKFLDPQDLSDSVRQILEV